jgi:carbon monoxide dehydrogenase subunit G
MEFSNSFTVPAHVDAVWELLLDVERVVPCMPGAELIERKDDDTYAGKVNIKVGPIAMSFKGEATFEEIDQPNRTIKLKASGKEARGRGGAQASVLSQLEELDSGTQVNITTTLQLSGTVAQFGRGMVADISTKLVSQFADCLAAQMGPGANAGADGVVDYVPPPPAADKPLPVVRLVAKSFWDRMVAWFKRRRSPSPRG